MGNGVNYGYVCVCFSWHKPHGDTWETNSVPSCKVGGCEEGPEWMWTDRTTPTLYGYFVSDHVTALPIF